MYAASIASTASSPRAAAAERRVRVVRLLRPRRSTPAFGFCVRGGNEHATGFFISKVEFNSEAHMQGLQVGDQLMSVNGYRVDDAVHRELTHYLASQSRLKVKVRHVGMIPVKEKPHDALSWQFTSERMSVGSDVSSSPTILHESQRTSVADMRLSILVPPRAKLGCGICKGPEWKPGIFVQFVRDGGIAREAGLRPGDQILACNGKDFSNVPFHEAISIMKSIGRLELVIREGAGAELVSPESSGYNSSASSAAGERCPAPAPAVALAPPAALRKKLASVAEEAADRADRLTANRVRRRTWDSLDFDWKHNDLHNFDVPSDIEPDYDCPSIPNNPHTFENKTNSKPKNTEYISSPSNRTIINLTEDGATIECYDTQNRTFSNNNKSSRDEKKTIVVEVHHNNTVQCNFPPPPKMEPCFDTASLSSTNTLSNAIAEEIQRRKMVNSIQLRKMLQNLKTRAREAKTRENLYKKTGGGNQPRESAHLRLESWQPYQIVCLRLMWIWIVMCFMKPKDANTPPAPTLLNPSKSQNASKLPEDDKRKQHDALMDEFKKVHRRMFKNQEQKTDSEKDNHDDSDSMDRQAKLPLKILENGNGKPMENLPSKKLENGTAEKFAVKSIQNGVTNKVAVHKFENGKSDKSPLKIVNGTANKIVENGNHQVERDVRDGPPPPPPMPMTNGHHNEVQDKQKSIKEIGEELLNNAKRNGTLTRTPSPDYNTKGTSFSNAKLDSKNGDKAELESIESYKMRNPSNVSARPPSHYFYNAPNGTATMKKLRPVSVTIGEYACAGSRKEPSKLEFLNGDKSDEGRDQDDVPISNRLQSELALTLSRSNLRKKTEVSDPLVSVRSTQGYEDICVDRFFRMRYSDNVLPLPPTITIPKGDAGR